MQFVPARQRFVTEIVPGASFYANIISKERCLIYEEESAAQPRHIQQCVLDAQKCVAKL